jgi:hypothetical protein
VKSEKGGKGAMVKFSGDVDIARYEPVLFGELYLSSQVLIAGQAGRIEGTTFSDTGADFESGGVKAGGVIYVRSQDSVVDGVYEIVSVDSATELTISVIRPDGSAAGGEVSAPPACEDLVWRISTFEPQALEAGLRLTENFGIRPGNPNSEYSAEDIVDACAMRVASVFMVLSSVYAVLASKADNDNMWSKSLFYKREFEKSMERCRFSIDTDGDGVGDCVFTGGSIKLMRE